MVDNLIAIATWWTSLLWRVSNFEAVSRRFPFNGLFGLGVWLMRRFELGVEKSGEVDRGDE